MASARDRVLDSFVAIVCEEGERPATLDAVAARAGVSKGGLLYHFGSKAALVEGLCERLSDLSAIDVERMQDAEDGAARYFVRNCLFVGSELDLALLAASRLQQAGYEEAGRTSTTPRTPGSPPSSTPSATSRPRRPSSSSATGCTTRPHSVPRARCDRSGAASTWRPCSPSSTV